jgi:hypothetical protein
MGDWEPLKGKAARRAIVESFRQLVPRSFEVSDGIFQSLDDDNVLFTVNGKWRVDGVWGRGKAGLSEALRTRRGNKPKKRVPRKEAAVRDSLPLNEWERKFSASIRKISKKCQLTEKQVNCANGILDKVGEEHCELLFGVKQLGVGVVRPPKNKAWDNLPQAEKCILPDEPDDCEMTAEYLHLMRQML